MEVKRVIFLHCFSSIASDTEPTNNSTTAPLCFNSRAKAIPIFPEEPLVIPRTGSLASTLPPRVNNTFSQLKEKSFPNTGIFFLKPTEVLATCLPRYHHKPPPHKWVPSPLPPLPKVPYISLEPGWDHMVGFMAGKRSRGQLILKAVWIINHRLNPWLIWPGCSEAG